MRLRQSRELKFLNALVGIVRGSETEAHLHRHSPVAGTTAPAAKTTATAATETAKLGTERPDSPQKMAKTELPTGFERLTLLKRFEKFTENCML